MNSVVLWKLRYELLKFRLRPRPGGGGANVPQRTNCKREFCNVVAACSFNDEEQIVLTGREVDLLDIDAQFFASSFAAWLRLGASLTPRIP